MSKKPSFPSNVIYICQGSKCAKRGGRDIEKAFEKVLKSNKNQEDFEVLITECTDRCKFAPIVCFQPENLWLTETNEKECLKVFHQIIEQNII